MRNVLRHIILKPIDMKKSSTNKPDLIHRMKMIIDDAKVVIDHLENNKGMNAPTIHADDAWTHISNIEIAIDLGSTESREWKKLQNEIYNKHPLLRRRTRRSRRGNE